MFDIRHKHEHADKDLFQLAFAGRDVSFVA